MEIRMKLKGTPFLNYLLFALLIVTPTITFAQSLRELHKEEQDDTYIAVNKESMERGPAYYFQSSSFFTTQVNIDADGNDIIGDAGNETSIAVDPTNPNRIVIGWRQFDTVTSNFRQAGNGYSLDGGVTWTFPGVLNPGVFRSDPVLDFDAEGNLYYNSLKNDFTCDVYKITDGGVDWGAPFPAYGGDKQWMRIDKTSGIGAGNNYSNWNSSFTTCAPGFFTRSTDGSNTFEDCAPVDGDPFWGTLAVDADGALYTVGAGGSSIILVKSTTAQNPAISPVTWDFTSSVNLDGQLNGFIDINPQGLLGQAWVDVDISNGPGHGNVYVLASVSRNSNSDPGDVMFAKSTDGGITFEAPIRINTDSGTNAYQWFGTMSVAPNGRIDVAWLDTRDAPVGTHMSSLYFSYSEDQGTTWSANEVLSIAFDPHIGYPQQDKMGDYFDMVSDNEGAHLAWVNTINGGEDVYYTHITPSLLGVDDFLAENSFYFKTFPNPFKDETSIEFFSKNEENVTIEVFNLTGRKVNTLLDETVSGKQRLKWNGTDNNETKLSPGLYFIRVKTNSFTKVVKVILQ